MLKRLLLPLSLSFLLSLLATSLPAQTGSGTAKGVGTITLVPASGNANTPPICGIVSNTSILIPAVWTSFSPPAVGSTYTDSGGYCPVTRVTNYFSGPSGSDGCHYYATEGPDDISDQYIMLYNCNSGGFFVVAGPTNGLYTVGTTVLTGSQMGTITPTSTEPTWDRTSPGVFWITAHNTIEKCTINNSAKTVSCAVNHTFTEYASGQVTFMDETDMTPDGWLVTVGSNTTSAASIAVFLWNPTTLTKSAVYSTVCTDTINKANGSCIHKLIATPLDGVVIQFEGSTNPENGNQLWESPFSALQPVELNSGGTGPGGSGGTDHFDSMKNQSSVEVGNFEDFQNNPGPWGACVDSFRPTTVTLPPASNAPQCLFSNRSNNPGWHVSSRAWPKSNFVTFSAQANTSAAENFNNATSGYAAPSSGNWNVYTNEIVMILVGANNNSAQIYRLALAHARGNPGYFWSDPRAAMTYSGNYIVFDSNSAWGATGSGTCNSSNPCSDTYIIKIH
jgi:hypothetical protein